MYFLKWIFGVVVAPMALCGVVEPMVSEQILENEFIKASFTVDRGVLRGMTFGDKISGRVLTVVRPFAIDLLVVPEDDASDVAVASVPATLCAEDFVAGVPRVEKLEGSAKGRRLIDRVGGTRVTVPLAARGDGLSVVWSVELRDDANFLEQSLVIAPLQFSAEVREVRLLDIVAADARVVGVVPGSPVVIGSGIFAGVEHPMAENRVEKGHVVGGLKRKVAIAPRRTLEISAVLGVTRPGQLRREFQEGYINRVRARPYETFLNYNTWYDIGYFTRYDEKAAMNVVKAYGEELVRKRGVKVDSFLFDDGWDDTATLWEFDRGLPNEFHRIDELCKSYGATPGVWFSPWGGYGPPKDQRIAAAKKVNPDIETNSTGFALSGKGYYKVFRDMCVRMIRENGVRHFKFDGTGDAGSVQKGSEFGSDFDAVIALIGELREIQPDLYINLTTGTWASPFWFKTADSIWRGGFDHEFAGVGTARERWVTFRDAMTYKYNVKASPLFPINSLMLHGVVYAQGARGLNQDAGHDLPNEIWTAFGCGSQMQELYVTPGLMKSGDWDEIADGAKWAREKEQTLMDTHWVGGDPGKLEVYGWASWSPREGILVLRNPADRVQTFSADVGSLFELPLGAAMRYRVTTPRKGVEAPLRELQAGRSFSLSLKPFEVVVLDAQPVE